VHQRTDWDLTDPLGPARKYAYWDNRTSEVGLDFDAEQILADINAGVDLAGMFLQSELDELLGLITFPELNTDAQNLESNFDVIVTCADEQAQIELLEKLTDQGYTCQALVS